MDPVWSTAKQAMQEGSREVVKDVVSIVRVGWVGLWAFWAMFEGVSAGPLTMTVRWLSSQGLPHSWLDAPVHWAAGHPDAERWLLFAAVATGLWAMWRPDSQVVNALSLAVLLVLLEVAGDVWPLVWLAGVAVVLAVGGVLWDVLDQDDFAVPDITLGNALASPLAVLLLVVFVPLFLLGWAVGPFRSGFGLAPDASELPSGATAGSTRLGG